MERARFVVARLAQGKLGASACLQAIVRGIIWLESRNRVHDCKDRMVRLQHAEHRLVDVRVASRGATGRQASRQPIEAERASARIS
jgi:hypothetical protein